MQLQSSSTSTGLIMSFRLFKALCACGVGGMEEGLQGCQCVDFGFSVYLTMTPCPTCSLEPVCSQFPSSLILLDADADGNEQDDLSERPFNCTDSQLALL